MNIHIKSHEKENHNEYASVSIDPSDCHLVGLFLFMWLRVHCAFRPNLARYDNYVKEIESLLATASMKKIHGGGIKLLSFPSKGSPKFIHLCTS